MNNLRGILRAIAGLFLTTIVVASGLAECREPAAAKQAEVVTYVMKKYQIASSSNLSLTTSAKANDACFWKMEYTTSSPKRSIVLYLSPDRQYLVPLLYDLALDPLVEMRAKNEQLSKDLMTGGSPALGSLTAPVTIVEFSDFECPFCKRMTDVLEKEVLPNQGGKVKVVFRNYPLPMHPWAKDAAEIAECAGLQKPEAFWAMHDFFFQNQQTLRPDTVKVQAVSFAAGINGLDQGQFAACVDRDLGLGPVMQDQQLGQKMGIHGTPSLFINGVRFDGLRSAQELDGLIEQAAKGELMAPSEQTAATSLRPVSGGASAGSASAQCVPSTRTGGTSNVQ